MPYTRKVRVIEKPCDDCGGPIMAHRSDVKRCAGCKQAHTREQDRVHQKARRAASGHKEKYREWCLRTKYGISGQDVTRMLEKQDGCAICHADNPQWTKDWHVDHNHTTGKVRGILCHKCNVMLGQAGDNIVTLLSAIAYLRAAEEVVA